MIRQTARRPGVTLMEVLIAIGILAIGMLAIMALFPIGAVSMARAINQNRAADHAANSDAMFRYYWKKAWLDANGGVRSSTLEAYTANPIEEMIPLLDRKRPINPLTSDIPASSSQPSYLVLVDPVGWHTQPSIAPANQWFVAGSPALPQRTSLAAAETLVPRSVIRTTTLLDDMSWDVNGEPATDTNQLERGGRYNCAWLIQRAKNNIPFEVHLYVLVYSGRSPTDTPSAETALPAQVTGYVDGVDPKPNTVTVSLGGGTMPNVRRGGWVAFSVPVMPVAGVPYPTLDFYRVASIDDSVPDQITLELEQPLRSYASATITGYNANGGTFIGNVIFFDNLFEVFDRGTVSAQGISGR